jgi:hypothetical protein
MRAWWVCWISIAIAAVAWIAAPLILGRGEVRSFVWAPVGLLFLVVPLIVAGIDLIAYRRSHEEICRLEAQRHGWLRRLVGDGYSARTFAWTGVALVALAGLVLVWGSVR